MLLKWGFPSALLCLGFALSSLVISANSVIAFYHKMMVYDFNFQHCSKERKKLKEREKRRRRRQRQRRIKNINNNMHVERICWPNLFFRFQQFYVQKRRSTFETLLGRDKCFFYKPTKYQGWWWIFVIHFTFFAIMLSRFMSEKRHRKCRDKVKMINGQLDRALVSFLRFSRWFAVSTMVTFKAL